VNPSQTALAAGFSVLLVNNGEPLILLRQDSSVLDVPAIVDRTLDPRAFGQAKLNFDIQRASRIRLFATAVVPAPQVGETFKDEADVYHAIKEVKSRGQTLVCICEASE
jgi:hypothetical protein